ncbi:MAG: tyrosine-type recombinase/integrase [Alphaproteobacteria bacterium]|nr:tyrosine-type recombinase/integrase [Alphaproteobacteria bacterium]HJM93598.1 tyrosine-type recombinase/integrase [Alphaproteobacteria bacterium]
MVPAVRLTKSFLAKFKTRSSTVNEHVRDTESSGLLATRFAKSGQISFVYIGRIKGSVKREITIGRYPDTAIEEARIRASELRRLYRQGIDPKQLEADQQAAQEREKALQRALQVSLRAVLERYLLARNLKPKTDRDYRSTMQSCFADWLDEPIRNIERRDAEDRYVGLVKKGIKAQAVKAFRILSAIMNFAKAEEVSADKYSNTASERLIRDNPCDVLKEKRYDRHIPARTHALTLDQTANLLEYLSHCDHPQFTGPKIRQTVANYIGLLLFTGIRREEAARLEWSDVDLIGLTFTLHDTKNGLDFVVPMSIPVHGVLTAQQKEANGSQWVFPAATGDGPLADPRKALEKVSDYIGVRFTSHTIRHTFGSIAFEFNFDWGNIKKMLNYKTGDITSRYVHANVKSLRPMFDEIAQGLMLNYDGSYLGNDGEPEHVYDEDDDF